MSIDGYHLGVTSGDEAKVPILGDGSTSFEDSYLGYSNQYDALRPNSIDGRSKTSADTVHQAGPDIYRETSAQKSVGGVDLKSRIHRTKSDTFTLSTSKPLHLMNGESQKCNNLQTLMNIIKGTLGTGILTLPMAFLNGGLWVGLFGFLFLASIAVHCQNLLNNCAASLEHRENLQLDNYEATVYYCFKFGPRRLQSVAPFMKALTTTLINVLQCSFCCVYGVWVASNVKPVVDEYWGSSPDVRVNAVVVLVFVYPYVMVKSLRTMAVFSALANLLYAVGLVIIFQYIFQDLPDYRKRPAFASWATLPSFFGTCIFSYESISLVIPIRNKMKTPEDLGGWAGVLNLAMVIITSSYAAVGFYGYLRFGDDVEPAITLNLPHHGIYLWVRIMFAIGVFITIGLQFYVPITNIWPVIEGRLKPNRSRMLWAALTRIVLITIVFAIGILIPHFEILIALIGSLFGSVVAIILPAVLDLITLSSEENLTVFAVVKDVFIILIGILGFATGTFTSTIDILNSF